MAYPIINQHGTIVIINSNMVDMVMVITWRKTTLLRTKAAAGWTRNPTTTSPTLAITSSPTDNLKIEWI